MAGALSAAAGRRAERGPDRASWGPGSRRRPGRAAERSACAAVDVDRVIEQRAGQADRARSSPRTARRRSARVEERITLELLRRPEHRRDRARRRRGRLGRRARRAGATTSWSGSTSTSTPPGRAVAGHRPAAGRRPAERSSSCTPSASRSTTSSPTSSCPSERVARDGGRARRAATACPPGVAHAVGGERARATTRPTSAPGCSPSPRFWPATVARPAVPGHRRHRRPALRRRARAARRPGDDHARRAVQDDRPRRDRVVGAGPRPG